MSAYGREQREWMSQRFVPVERLIYLGGTPGRMFRVVAKEGAIGDWAAYAHYAEEHDALDTADHGYKLMAEDAAALFPMLNVERYRS